jgi:hypothetical protein
MATNNDSLSENRCCLISFFESIWLAIIWPILCLSLGTALGSLIGAFVTLIIFLFTAIRTPMHIFKMLYVTAKTDECFRGHLGGIMRMAVFLCVPILPLVFLVCVTLFCATIGTLYYIGKATKVVYKNEYRKTLKQVESNARLKPDSHMGEYIKGCQQFMETDELSHSYIYSLKGVIAMIPGLLLASIVFIPYSLTILLITLYRLPINFFKTMKIALFTVVLDFDLRLVVLLTLPIIHILFPIVTFICAMFGSFFWAWFIISENIFEGGNPCKSMANLKKSLNDYHKAHEEFVTVHCEQYDHPSGIPDGWDGTSYGIAIERILRWQVYFLICCMLIVLELPICLVFVTIVSIVKYIPSCFYVWGEYASEYCCDQNQVALWPFHLLGFLCLPAGILLCHVALIVLAVFRVPIQISWTFLDHKDHKWLGDAWLTQFEIIRDHDKMTGDGFFNGYLLFDEERSVIFLPSTEPSRLQRGATRTRHPDPLQVSESIRPSFWDRFALQCTHTTSVLLDGGWITKDQVANMDPSAIQSIPAVAILTVLMDSVKQEEGLGKDDLRWTVDGTICRERPRADDAIAQRLWPMVTEIKRLLHSQRQQEEFLAQPNLDVLAAILCANMQIETQKIKETLGGAKSCHEQLNKRLQTKITALVLAVLRVKPFQQRMNRIFTQEYNVGDPESPSYFNPVLSHGSDPVGVGESGPAVASSSADGICHGIALSDPAEEESPSDSHQVEVDRGDENDHEAASEASCPPKDYESIRSCTSTEHEKDG